MILIIGYGCEGRAIYGIMSSSYDMAYIDPKYSSKTISDYSSITGIIYCIPFINDDISKISDILQYIDTSTPIMIRSTMSVAVWQKIKEKYSEYNITYSPSFLRKALCAFDMKNLKELFLSGKDISYWKTIFKNKYVDLTIHTDYTIEETIMIKLMRTAFLSVKLSFFNQIYELCNELNIDYDVIRSGITHDSRIGESHSFIDMEFSRFYKNKNINSELVSLFNTTDNAEHILSIISLAKRYNDLGDQSKIDQKK